MGRKKLEKKKELKTFLIGEAEYQEFKQAVEYWNKVRGEKLDVSKALRKIMSSFVRKTNAQIDCNSSPQTLE